MKIRIRKRKPKRTKLGVRIRVVTEPWPEVVEPHAGFPKMMAALVSSAREKTPVLFVRFKKPFGPKRIGGIVTIKRYRGKLFQWGGIPLVSHASPYHAHEWIVSEFQTGLNVCSREPYMRKYDAFLAGSRGEESAAREEAVLFLMRYGVECMKKILSRRPKRNLVTLKMRRYIKEVLYA